MNDIKEQIIKNKKPLIIGAVIGLIVGIYGTSHYYQSEYAKLTAFTNMFGLGDIVNKRQGNQNEQIKEIVKSLRALRESVDDKVIDKLDKIEKLFKEGQTKQHTSYNSSLLSELAKDFRSRCDDCNEVEASQEVQESNKDQPLNETNR